jgi:hypothetical protein
LSGRAQANYYWFPDRTPFPDGPTFKNSFAALKVGVDYNFNAGVITNPGAMFSGSWGLPVAAPPDAPPLPSNLKGYIGGQFGGATADFRIGSLNHPNEDENRIQGSSWAGGLYGGLEFPTPLANLGTRLEISYLTTGARATLDMLSGGDITKSICGFTSFDALAVYYLTPSRSWAVLFGLGAGDINIGVKTADQTIGKSGVAGDLIVGLEYAVDPYWSVGGRYTHIMSEQVTFGRTQVATDVDMWSVNLTRKIDLGFAIAGTGRQ